MRFGKVARVNRPDHSTRAARVRRAGLIALVALFWAAQLQGLTHLVSHLGRDHAAPHSLVCGDCIVSAEAGAAPPSTLAAPARMPAQPALAARPVAGAAARHVHAAYRSRAPPAVPT